MSILRSNPAGRGATASRCVIAPVVLVSVLLFLPGCRRHRASVYPPTGHIDPKVSVGRLPEARKAKDAKAPARWYHALMKGGTRPTGTTGSSELVEVIDLDDPAAVQRYWNPAPKLGDAAPSALLADILNGVLAGKPDKSRWSLLRLELITKVAKRPSTMQVLGHLVLKDLYLRRPLIAFERVRLEECMTRLAKKAGLRHAQPRTHNPVITWRGENISVLGAVDAILEKYGFSRQITGAFTRARVKVKDHATRSAFVSATVARILAAGRDLDRDIPTLIVSPRIKPRRPRKEAEDTGESRSPAASSAKKRETTKAAGASGP
jgi:hypothetical protein